MEHFCDNPNCLNHRLPMNDERHYHTEDVDVFGPRYGLVKSHSYKLITSEAVKKSNWILFKSKVIRPEVKYFNFCDTCMSAINMVDRNKRWNFDI